MNPKLIYNKNITSCVCGKIFKSYLGFKRHRKKCDLTMELGFVNMNGTLDKKIEIHGFN